MWHPIPLVLLMLLVFVTPARADLHQPCGTWIVLFADRVKDGPDADARKNAVRQKAEAAARKYRGKVLVKYLELEKVTDIAALRGRYKKRATAISAKKRLGIVSEISAVIREETAIKKDIFNPCEDRELPHPNG